jgi:hypothetical protein
MRIAPAVRARNTNTATAGTRELAVIAASAVRKSATDALNASQRVRAKRGPMTGSARLSHYATTGCCRIASSRALLAMMTSLEQQSIAAKPNSRSGPVYFVAEKRLSKEFAETIG